LIIQIVDHFLRRVIVFRFHRQPEPALFGPQHHGLALHAAHHVKRELGLAPEGHLKEVFLDALLDGLLKLTLDLEVPVSGAEAADALVRPLVIVVLHPLPDALSCVLKTLKLRPAQKLEVDGLPEPLDLAQRHRMMRP
jgi:hypothetical protein